MESYPKDICDLASTLILVAGFSSMLVTYLIYH